MIRKIFGKGFFYFRRDDLNRNTYVFFYRSSSETGTAGPKSLCGQSVASMLSVLSLRPKDETADEKKERKRLLKEYRAERRIERKANTTAFKEEKRQQDRNQINNRNNIQGKGIV